MEDIHEDFARLRELLGSSDPDVRGMTAVALTNVADPEATVLLVELLDDVDKRVVCAAAQSLGERGDKTATDALVKLLKRMDVETKCSALSALALLRDQRAFPAVVVELFDVDDEVRRNAAGAIGCLGDQRALEPLYEVLHDPYLWVRANAALSIGMLANPASVLHLLDLFVVEQDDMVRGNILIALGECDPTQAPRIIEALLDVRESEKARVSANLALASLAKAGKLADEDAARKAVLDTLTSEEASDEVHAAGAWTLGRMASHPDITAALLQALNDDYRWVVLYALESLALQKDKNALESLRAHRELHADDEELIEHLDRAVAEIEQS